tara:strand:+ start:6617 stop:7357 length:741 start_codon:yes stop_codon:yes gene_type:complete
MSLGNSLGLSVSNPRQSGSAFNACSVDFDGTDQDVNINNMAGTINVYQFSFSLWIKLGTQSSSGVLFKFISDSSNNQILCLFHGSGNEIRFTHKMNGQADVCNGGSGNVTENDGTWWHIAGTVDKTTTNQIVLYVNGTAKETITGVGTIEAGKSMETAAIGSNSESGAYIDATMNSVIFWNRALGSDEINTIYRARSNYNALQQGGTDLFAWYMLNDGSGDKAVNKVDTSSLGTYRNSPVWLNDTP